MTEKYQCKICNKLCSYGGGLHRHLKLHSVSLNQYYDDFPEEKIVYSEGSREKRRKNSPKCIEFYLNKGFTLEESQEKLNEHNILVKQKTAETDKLYNPISRSYWEYRGYNSTEIDELLSKRNTRGLQYFIDKYGEIEGKEKERLYRNKVGNSLKNDNRLIKLQKEGHTLDEAIEIQRKNHANGPKNKEYWIKKGYTDTEAEQLKYNYSLIQSPRRKEYWMHHHNFSEDEAIIAVSKFQNNKRVGFGGASKWSLIFIKQIVEICINNDLRYEAINYGSDGKCEKFLYCYDTKRCCFYDLCIEELNIIIEFHGEKFHPYPLMNDDEKQTWKMLYTNKTFDEVIIKDNEKRKIAEKYGYRVFELWQRTEKEDFERIIRELKEIINERQSV